MVTDKSKVIAIKSFNSVTEAQIFKALLESAGVQARMQNDVAAQVLPAYGNLMQVNLLVAEEDEAKAREILAAKYDKDEVKQGTMAGQNDAAQ